MKKLVAGLLVAAVAACGCNTSNVGGPGATGGSPRAMAGGERASGYGPGASSQPAGADHHVAAADSPHGGTPAVGGKDTFRLTGPTTVGSAIPSVTLKQGEKKEITVGISRGSDFKDNVRLEVPNPPKGLTVQPEKPAIPASDKDVKVMVEAAKDAPLGTHEVDLRGTSEKAGGPSADLKLEIKVDKGGEK